MHITTTTKNNGQQHFIRCHQRASERISHPHTHTHTRFLSLSLSLVREYQPLVLLYKIVLKMPQDAKATHAHSHVPHPFSHNETFCNQLLVLFLSLYFFSGCLSQSQPRNCCSPSVLASVSVCSAFHLTYKLPFIVES